MLNSPLLNVQSEIKGFLARELVSESESVQSVGAEVDVVAIDALVNAGVLVGDEDI